MKKIVINTCYGGFSLSTEAVLLARKLSGNPLIWDCPIKNGETYENGEAYIESSLLRDWHHPDVRRDDPTLVRVVEILGAGANGRCADLQVVLVEGKYRIVEYDGREFVETPENIQWDE